MYYTRTIRNMPPRLTPGEFSEGGFYLGVFVQKTLNIIGEINSEMVKDVFEQLDSFEEDATTTSVLIKIRSDGGDSDDGVAIALRIRESRLITTTVGYGTVASSAVIILCAGRQRYLWAGSYLMMHQDAISVDVRTDELVRTAAAISEKEKTWCELLEKYTKVHYDTWKKLHEVETYISAEKAQKLKIAKVMGSTYASLGR